MILPDVNVLVYAFRRDVENHSRYQVWLDGVVNGEEAYGVSPQVLSGVVRICTHPRIFTHPDNADAVLKYCQVLLDQPHCQIVEPGPRHWTLFSSLCRSSGASGNLVSDAWFAALAIESGSEWITTDRDYARFEGLRWRLPF